MNRNLVDVAANRRATKWSRREMLARVLWGIGQVAFRWSPRVCWRWRAMLLSLFGADIGRNVHVYPSVRITMPWHLSVGDEAAIGDGVIIYALGSVRIGRRSTISQYAHLCAGSHDYADRRMTLTKPPITVGDDVWICADAFLGPGVTVGDGAVVGARAVVVADVPPRSVVGGNPARLLKTRPDPVPGRE